MNETQRIIEKAQAMEQTGKAIAGVGCVTCGVIFFGVVAVIGIVMVISMVLQT